MKRVFYRVANYMLQPAWFNGTHFRLSPFAFILQKKAV